MHNEQIYFFLGGLWMHHRVSPAPCVSYLVRRGHRFLVQAKMLKMVAAGSRYPSILTLFISSILAIWAMYGFAAAGLLPALPLQTLALLITSAFLLRGLFFYPLMKKIKGNSLLFWLVSSAICTALGSPLPCRLAQTSHVNHM